MANITYKRSFQHDDWIDNEDVVQAGGERGFNVKFHSLETEFDNIAAAIAQISAGLGGFQPLGASGALAYAGGNVGIGTSFTTNPPVYHLEVNLGANTATTEQVRFGHAVCCNGGAGAFAGYAVFAHNSHASDSNYALRQGPNGDVDMNAAAGRPVSIRNGDTVRLGISAAGNVVVGSDTELPGAGTAMLQVVGEAFKLTGSASWLVPSDARLKENVRDLEVGLAQLRRVRPVRFRYNGRSGTTAGQECVGVLGQEIEKIFPEMIRRVPGRLDGEHDTEDLRIYDGSALTFILVNAVKELAGKVEQLEQALAEARKERGADGTTGLVALEPAPNRAYSGNAAGHPASTGGDVTIIGELS
ncbi:MAG: tail fiber domain-containing protein [Methylococcaceae bacterium]